MSFSNAQHITPSSSTDFGEERTVYVEPRIGVSQKTSNSSMQRTQSMPALQPQLDSLRERLVCLIRQEEEHYLCQDYLQGLYEEHQQQAEPNCNESASTKPQSCLAAEQCARIVSDLAFSSLTDEALQTFPSSVCVKDLADSQARASFMLDKKAAASPALVGFWRQQMLDWSNLVVDSFGIDRDVVAVSFNILDRYIAQEIQSNIPITREDFQLFSMTALFIAVKLLESYPRKLTADALVDMSRGFYAREDILHTEREILKTLGFFLNPTTTFGFCRMYWEMFPLAASFEFQASCQSIAEFALKDTYFLAKKPSVVGLAAVMHASRLQGHPTSVSETFLSEMRATINMQDGDDFGAVYDRLELVTRRQG